MGAAISSPATDAAVILTGAEVDVREAAIALSGGCPWYVSRGWASLRFRMYSGSPVAGSVPLRIERG